MIDMLNAMPDWMALMVIAGGSWLAYRFIRGCGIGDGARKRKEPRRTGRYGVTSQAEEYEAPPTRPIGGNRGLYGDDHGV